MNTSAAIDSLPSGRRSLNALVRPRTIAVIGAFDHANSVGHTLVRNLHALHKRDTVFLVSAHYATIEGVPTYPSITALPMAVDLAVIATPAPTVPAIIRAPA